MSDIYPDTQIVDLNTRESIKSWIKSSNDGFVELDENLFEKLDKITHSSWVEISENIWATSNHGKKSKIAMLTKVSPNKSPL